MIIKIDEQHELEYSNGFWNVNIYVKNNSSHHRTKNSGRMITDHCGDLGRCIANLITRKGDVEQVSKLLNTYKKCLYMFKQADTYTFEDKVTWSCDNATATTNKNYHGVMLDFQYLSTHNKPTYDQFTTPDHKGAAKKVLNADVYRYVDKPTVDGLCDAMFKISKNLSNEISRATIA